MNHCDKQNDLCSFQITPLVWKFNQEASGNPSYQIINLHLKQKNGCWFNNRHLKLWYNFEVLNHLSTIETVDLITTYYKLFVTHQNTTIAVIVSSKHRIEIAQPM